MRRIALVAALLAAVSAAPASAKVPNGPAGDAFYTYSKKLPSKHGTAVWQRKLTGQAALKGGSSTLLATGKSSSGRPRASSVRSRRGAPDAAEPGPEARVRTPGHG